MFTLVLALYSESKESDALPGIVDAFISATADMLEDTPVTYRKTGQLDCNNAPEYEFSHPTASRLLAIAVHYHSSHHDNKSCVGAGLAYAAEVHHELWAATALEKPGGV